MFPSIRRLSAAVLVGVMLLTAGCSGQSGPAIAEPSYPQMAPYPDESKYYSTLTGEFDYEAFEEAYDAWREDLLRQRDQPEGYAGELPLFFAESIPVFLDSTAANPVCSPLNLYMALSMLAQTAAGDSRQQILEALHSESISALRDQAGHVWNAHYCADGATASLLANSLWLQEGLVYNEETVRTLSDSFYASVFQGKLGSQEMNTALREWLNTQTGGLLEEQTQNVTMDPQTVMALASTIYYRAKWRSEFLEAQNTQSVFHAPEGDRTVTFMNSLQPYGPYFWGDDFSAVFLSLEDDSRMWLILPDEGKTPENILGSGLALDMILNHSSDYENQKSIQVNLSMPKFDILADTQIEESLHRLGITQVFDPEQADFSTILPSDPAWLDRVQHTARVMVDEEGVAAAAYTVMMTAGAAMPPEEEVDFILNRPFLFVITSRDSLPLFAGIVNTP